MKIGGRLEAAIEILKKIDQYKSPASEVLKEWARAHRFAGVKDRAFIGNIVYDVLRKKLFLQWRIDSDKMDDLAFASLLESDKYKIEDLQALLKEDQFSHYNLADNQKLSLQKTTKEKAPALVLSNMPEIFFYKLAQIFQKDADLQGAALSLRPPLDMRVNSLKASTEKLIKAFKHIPNLAPITWFSQGLRILPRESNANHPNVQIEPAFQKGWFEIQDLGSQLIAYLAFNSAHRAQKSSLQILDYCAGGGGKTLAISALMQNRGQIHAYDKEKSRLAPIFDRLRRASIRNSQVHSRLDSLKALEKKMDLVICDVPCSGSGTWRRHPDAKWRLKEEQIHKRTKEQKDILQNVRIYVKKEGLLAYMTCSLFREENDDQIQEFLTHNPDYRAVCLREIWQNFMPPMAPLPLFTRYGLLLSPYQTQTDGFYLAILQKL